MKLFKSKTSNVKSVNINDVTQSDLNQGILVLGSGCKKCHKLNDNCLEAIQELGLEVTVRHITDFKIIANYGVMSLPAIVINGEVASTGKVLSVNEIKTMLGEKL